MRPQTTSSSHEPHPCQLEMDAPYRAYLFGRLRVYRAQEPLQLRSVRRGSLQILQWFLLNPGKPCTADQMIDMLWPETDPDKTSTQFHVSLHALKRLIEPSLGPREESGFIHRHSNKVYSFDTDEAWWTDVADVEYLHQRGHECERHGNINRARSYYRRVAGYVAHGELAEDATDTWLDPYRRRYKAVCTQSLAGLMRLDAACGDDDELMASAYLTLQIDRYNALAVRAIVDGTIRNGDRRRAQDVLTRYCDSVRTDLGVAPPSELIDIQSRLRDGHLTATAAQPLPTAVRVGEVPVRNVPQQRRAS